MHSAAVLGLVFLFLIPPATYLVHRGIERDVRRWEEKNKRQVFIKINFQMAEFQKAVDDVRVSVEKMIKAFSEIKTKA